MASPNAGPITGSELLVALQGNQRVHLTRPQVAQLLALQSQPSDRPFAVPTSFSGTERISAIQGGQRITLTGADLATYLAATGVPDPVAPSRQPTTLVGIERLVGLQDGSRVAFSIAETIAVRDGGGTPTPTPSPTLNALSVSPNTSPVGTPYTGTISGGITAGSTITLTGPGAAGLSVSGTTISGTPTTAGAVNIVETLAGATNSPNPSNGVINVAAAAVSALLMGSRFNQMGFNGYTGSDGTDTDSNSRISSFNETGATVTKVRAYFANWYATNTNETNGFNDIVVRAAVEYPAGTFTPLTFGGASSTTITNSGTASLAESDEGTLATPVPAGAQYWLRTYVSAAPGAKWPQGYLINTALGEAADFSTGVEKTTSGTITNTTPSTTRRGYGPVAVKATAFSGTPVPKAFAALGDSIIMGSGDVGDSAAIGRGNFGYFAKACANNFPVINMGIAGTKLLDQQGANLSRRLNLLSKIGITHVHGGWGVNDTATTGRTASQQASDISAIAGAIKSAVPGVKVSWVTQTPKTSGTYLTAAGQTPFATPSGAFTGGASSVRAQINAMIRAGLANVDIVFDAAAAVEVDSGNILTQNGGLWISGNGGVGATSTHLTTTGAASDAATSDGLHPTVTNTTAPGLGGVYIMRDAVRAVFNGW